MSLRQGVTGRSSMTTAVEPLYSPLCEKHDVIHKPEVGWRRGVVVTELVVSTKLLYVDSG